MTQIGLKFKQDRSVSRSRAYKNMQLSIMENIGVLSQLWPPKDVIATSMDIEKFLKDNPDVSGTEQTPLEKFSDFLNNRSEQGPTTIV